MTTKQNILNAFQTAIETMGLEIQNERVRRIAQERGIPTALLIFRWSPYTVDTNREIRPTFGLTTHVDLRIQLHERHGVTTAEVEFRVTWPSGGGNVSLALAEASQHLEWIQKVARAEAIVRQELRGKDLAGAFDELAKECEETYEAVREALRAEKQEDSDS